MRSFYLFLVILFAWGPACLAQGEGFTENTEPCYFYLAHAGEPDADLIRSGTHLGGSGGWLEVYQYRSKIYVIIEQTNGYEFRTVSGSKQPVKHQRVDRYIYSDVRRNWVDNIPVIYSSDYRFFLSYGLEFHQHPLDTTDPHHIPKGTQRQWQGYVHFQRHKLGDRKGLVSSIVPYAETEAGHFLLDYPDRHHRLTVGMELNFFLSLVPKAHQQQVFYPRETE